MPDTASLEMVEGGLYRNEVGAELCLIGPAYGIDAIQAVFKTLAPGLWVAKLRTDWGSGTWLVTAEGMVLAGYTLITEEPTDRTVQEQAQDLVAADPTRFQAERDSDGVIRLNGGHGLAVAVRGQGRAEVERWFAQATRPYFAAQYLAVLRLFDREAADITEEPTE